MHLGQLALDIALSQTPATTQGRSHAISPIFTTLFLKLSDAINKQSVSIENPSWGDGDGTLVQKKMLFGLNGFMGGCEGVEAFVDDSG